MMYTVQCTRDGNSANSVALFVYMYMYMCVCADVEKACCLTMKCVCADRIGPLHCSRVSSQCSKSIALSSKLNAM